MMCKMKLFELQLGQVSCLWEKAYIITAILFLKEDIVRRGEGQLEVVESCSTI